MSCPASAFLRDRLCISDEGLDGGQERHHFADHRRRRGIGSIKPAAPAQRCMPLLDQRTAGHGRRRVGLILRRRTAEKLDHTGQPKLGRPFLSPLRMIPTDGRSAMPGVIPNDRWGNPLGRSHLALWPDLQQTHGSHSCTVHGSAAGVDCWGTRADPANQRCRVQLGGRDQSGETFSDGAQFSSCDAGWAAGEGGPSFPSAQQARSNHSPPVYPSNLIVPTDSARCLRP